MTAPAHTPYSWQSLARTLPGRLDQCKLLVALPRVSTSLVDFTNRLKSPGAQSVTTCDSARGGAQQRPRKLGTGRSRLLMRQLEIQAMLQMG